MASSTPSRVGVSTPTKNINTLVPDIYKVVDEGIELTEQERAELGAQLVDAVMQGLGKREEQPKGFLRMSNYGTPCKRKLWYTVNFPELAERIAAHTRIKFTWGHLTEALALFLTKKTGRKVEGSQDELEFQGIKGHRDAVIDGVTVDVKSANSRGMQKFRDHSLMDDDPFGYLKQLSLYAAASKDDPLVTVKKEAAFLAVDKELGHLVLDKYKVEEITEDDVKELKEVLANDEPPRRHYSPEPDGSSGNLKLPVACAYCPYKKECWKQSNQGRGLRTFIYSTGPRWLTHVARPPNVPEVEN